MKKGIAVSNVLSWLNLVIGASLTLLSFLTVIVLPITLVLLSVVLMGAIVLHSYAAIQLRRSLINPNIPLNKQTPVGIRMMGYMTLLVGFILFSNSIYTFQHIKEAVSQAKLPPQITEANFIKIIYVIGVFFLMFSFSLVLNVIMNFRFLKWYIISRNNNDNNPQ